MSRNTQNPELSGTECISKPSNKPTFKGHTCTLCLNTHRLLPFRKGITLSIIVDRCSLQERDWKSSMHSREETEWGSKLWIIIGDVAIPKISTRGNSRICWLDHGGREKKKHNSYIIMHLFHDVLCSYYSTELRCRKGYIKRFVASKPKEFWCGVKWKRKEAIQSPKVEKQIKLYFRIQISGSGIKSIFSVRVLYWSYLPKKLYSENWIL